MGMSASQARFLMLTARRSDIEYQVQQINQERLNLSNNMEGAARIYTDKLSNTVLVYRSAQNQANCTLTYDAITKSIPDGGMGMYIINSAGKIVVASQKELENVPEEEKSNYWVDMDLKDVDYLERNLKEGNYYIGQYGEENKMKEFALDGLSEVSEVLDTSDDAQAQAEYEGRMSTLQQQDKMLELQLTQLESEHQAIMTEIESIKDVINKDVESSFKTFGG